MSGLSFRNLGETLDINASTVYRKIKPLLEEMPHCADLSRGNDKHYSGILLLDGKYTHVKGYNDKIPVIYGIDYLTHDIVHFVLSKGENYQTSLSFFQSLRLLGYPLKALVCDDNQNFQLACSRVYPKSVIQICHNHYKENIRRQLFVRSDSTYRPFMYEIEQLFSRRRSIAEFFSIIRKILLKYGNDPKCQGVIIDIEKRKNVLLAYMLDKHIPRTTNLIECFNSHLEGRLKSVKGFESIGHARLWFNAYFIRRRLKPFTDCTGQFKKLNGKCSLETVIQNETKFQTLKQKFR
ncbi:transposase [Candidatus Shapirobacteria bacterium]|nr:transposase [Candidatus Shapirobacteria bacterium]